MAELPTLAELLELENDEELATLVDPDTGIAAWPAVRNDVIRKVLGELIYPTAPLVDPRRRPSATRAVRSALRAARWNLGHRAEPSEVLIVATGAGIRGRGGRLFNAYTDPFADELGDRAWTYESIFENRWRGVRSNDRLTFSTPDRLWVEMRSRAPVAPRHAVVARTIRETVDRRARTVLGSPFESAFLDHIERIAARRISAYRAAAGRATGLLRRVRPRLLLVEEGCYGHRAVLNTVAHERGLRVAEFQHGMITRGHDAYNVALAMARSDGYVRSQPDTLLTYGDWWSGQATAPVRNWVTIGNPQRRVPEAVAGESSRRVMLIGDGIETGWYLEQAQRLQSAAGAEWTSCFVRTRSSAPGSRPFQLRYAWMRSPTSTRRSQPRTR